MHRIFKDMLLTPSPLVHLQFFKLQYEISVICDVALLKCFMLLGQGRGGGTGRGAGQGCGADGGVSGDGPHTSGLGWAVARQTLLSRFGSLISCPN